MLGIVYRSRLPRPERLERLIDFARTRAELRGWLAADFEPRRLAGAVVRGPDGREQPPRDASLAGVWLNPHFASDDLCLVFDTASGELCDPSRSGQAEPPVLADHAIVRTTWADAGTHAAVIGLLEDLAAEDLASVEIGDPTGAKLAREPDDIAGRLSKTRIAAFRALLARPEEPARLRGVVELLAPAEAARRRGASAGPLDALAPAERALLERSRDRLLGQWTDAAPGLDREPALALPALEQLTDQLLSHPDYRHEAGYLERDFAWDSGALLGFLLIASLGGHWERVEGQRGPVLRVANLGGTGLLWRPFASAEQRLRSGVLHAHDAVAAWLASLVDAARSAGLGG